MVRELEKLSAYELLQFALVALNESEELFFLCWKGLTCICFECNVLKNTITAIINKKM